MDVATCESIMRVNKEEVVFNIFRAMGYPDSSDECFVVNIIQRADIEIQERSQTSDSWWHLLTSEDVDKENEELAQLMAWLNNQTGSSEDFGLKELLAM